MESVKRLNRGSPVGDSSEASFGLASVHCLLIVFSESTVVATEQATGRTVELANLQRR